MTKLYYLPQSRSFTVGIILLLMGLSPIFGTVLLDEHHSLWAGFFFFAELFMGFPEFIIGVIYLVILISGVLYLKRSRTVARVKLDENGIYYLLIGESRPLLLFNMFYLKAKLKLIPYNDIARAEYVVSKWKGDGITLHLKNGALKPLLGAVVSSADKMEIVKLINNRLTGLGSGK